MTVRYLDLGHVTPYQQPLRPQNPKRRLPRLLKLGLLTVFLSGLVYGGYILFWPAEATLSDIFKAPAAVLSFIRPAEQDLKSTNGRTNVLLLGTDYRKGMPSENLTDTMMVASVDIQSKTKDVAMISIPRDLWVTLPGWQYDCGGKVSCNFYQQGGKINSANAYGDSYDYPGGKGLQLARQTVEQVLGIKIHYVVRINFYGFKQVVDDLGGISINVENSFTDCEYPVEGKENALPLSSRYMCVSFKKGYQYMDGEKALEFSRSRHSADSGEGSDLARARRQQKVIVAIRDKGLSLNTLADPLKVSSLLKELGDNIQTLDVDFSQVGAFYKMIQLVNADSAEHIVLTNEPKYNPDGIALLSVGDSSLYGGQFVFLPETGAGDYREIQAYIKRKLAEIALKAATASAQSR